MTVARQWSDYVTTLVERGVVTHCAIYSHSGRQWTTSSPGFCLHWPQIDAILQGFQDDIELRKLGLHVSDMTFTLTRQANRHSMMIGRCSATGWGCVICKCGRCIVIGVHEEGAQAGLCYRAIERLGDVLLENGF